MRSWFDNEIDKLNYQMFHLQCSSSSDTAEQVSVLTPSAKGAAVRVLNILTCKVLSPVQWSCSSQIQYPQKITGWDLNPSVLSLVCTCWRYSGWWLNPMFQVLSILPPLQSFLYFFSRTLTTAIGPRPRWSITGATKKISLSPIISVSCFLGNIKSYVVRHLHLYRQGPRPCAPSPGSHSILYNI